MTDAFRVALVDTDLESGLGTSETHSSALIHFAPARVMH